MWFSLEMGLLIQCNPNLIVGSNHSKFQNLVNALDSVSKCISFLIEGLGFFPFYLWIVVGNGHLLNTLYL